MTAPAPAASAVADGLTPLQGELLSRADAIFASIAKAVSTAAAFTAEQVPDIAIQYVTYGRGYATFVMLLAMIFLVVGLTVGIRIGLMNTRVLPDVYNGDWHWGRIVSCFAGASLTAIGLIILLNDVKDFLLVWFAPKVWLIQELVHLVKR